MTIREIQIWGSLAPCIMFVIGYAVTEFRRNDPASWYILGWGVTCASAFTLTAIRIWLPDAAWTRYAGAVLGLMVLVMVWWMLFALLWVWRKRFKKGDRIDDATHDSE